MVDSENIEWHALDTEAVFQRANSSEEGLDATESKKRLKEYGFNILQTKTSETIPRILLRQLRNPIVYVLLISTLLAFALRKFTDGFVVFGVVILNTIIGFIQEYRANRVIRALSAMVPHETTVIRGGDQKLIPASHVIPGDVVFLQAGEKIPADVRLFSIKNLQCDESSLTGESLPVSKHTETISSEAPIAERKCMAFSGTYVTAGTGIGVVIATGLKTAPVLSGFILIRTLTVSVLMAAGAIGLFLWEYHLEISSGTVEKIAISEAQTMAVTALMLFQVFYLFHCRSLKLSVLKINFFSNPSILIGVGVVLLAQVAFIYVPFMNRLFHSSSLNMEAWMISTGVALLVFLLIAFEKKISQMITKNRDDR